MTGRTLILGLGNELLADDAVGVLVVRQLSNDLADRADIDVVGTPEHGLALLDLLIGYDEVVLVDAIVSGAHEPGEVFEIDPTELRPTPNPSPHYAGVPELLALGERLGLAMPRGVRIVAVEAGDLLTLGGPMTVGVRRALPELRRRVLDAVGVHAWS